MDSLRLALFGLAYVVNPSDLIEVFMLIGEFCPKV
jgi:uncharacterized membrane protein YkvA (DUF1232 family)